MQHENADPAPCADSRWREVFWAELEEAPEEAPGAASRWQLPLRRFPWCGNSHNSPPLPPELRVMISMEYLRQRVNCYTFTTLSDVTLKQTYAPCALFQQFSLAKDKLCDFLKQHRPDNDNPFDSQGFDFVDVVQDTECWEKAEHLVRELFKTVFSLDTQDLVNMGEDYFDTLRMDKERSFIRRVDHTDTENFWNTKDMENFLRVNDVGYLISLESSNELQRKRHRIKILLPLYDIIDMDNYPTAAQQNITNKMPALYMSYSCFLTFNIDERYGFYDCAEIIPSHDESALPLLTVHGE